jgi:hypothetical protein
VSLPPADTTYLSEHGIRYTVTPEGGMLFVILERWRLPSGYNRTSVDLLLRLPPGFPDVAPDMWWVSPPLKLFNGQPVKSAEVTQEFFGRMWQRWSRHFVAGQWRPGVDNMGSFLALVRGDMALKDGAR